MTERLGESDAPAAGSASGRRARRCDRTSCGRQRDWPPVLDADQLAELLHLGSRREVLKLVRARVLPHVRLGPKRILFLLDSVLEALKRREISGFTDAELGERE